LVALAFLLGACTSEPTDGEAAGPEPASYTVRGRVVAMPSTPSGEIQIEHEAIHEFVDFRGDVVGMDAMTMFFPLAEGVASEEIVAGDIVEFDLLVDWNAEPLSKITRIAKLPPETELVFGRAEPPTG
jgi:Cu/Ag efflux protein CusF